MRIIIRKALIDFYTEHTDAKSALEEWYSKAKKAEWGSFADMKRIEELLPLITDDMSIEYDLWCGLVSDYEDVHYPIATPSLGAIIKLRMYEMNLTQKNVAEMLGVSPSRISEFINEKSEPSLKTAREICQKLNIDAAIALGL